MTRYFMRLSIGTLVFIFLTSASVFGMKVYIPHITGGYDNWTDYLLVENGKVDDVSYNLHVVDQGSMVYVGTFMVPGLSGDIVDLKSLAPTAECGMITYNDTELSFRLAYNNLDGGGVAEFQLTGKLNTILSFNFSDFNPNISWKGIAIENPDYATASVDLYAIGLGGILGQDTINIAPYSRVLGTHDIFFPYLSFGDVKRIIAVSKTGLCGITISGSTDNSLLLYTAAASLPKFDSADPYPYNLIMTEKLQGTWYFQITHTITWNEWYHLNYPVVEDPFEPGIFDINGLDNYDGPVVAYYYPDSGWFILLDTGAIFDKYYNFHFTSENEVSGCYYDDGYLGNCYPMTGTKICPHIVPIGTSMK